MSVIEFADIALAKLAARINAEHAAVIGAVKRGIEHALTAGDLLLDAKDRVAHGEWLPWLKANCPDISERTAQLYMRLARHKSATVTDLTHLTLQDAVKMLSGGIQQLGGSGDNEYFTPMKYVTAVRDVLGVITLDPASCMKAQATVRAERYFTKNDNGLTREWHGKVFLNPPYSRRLLKLFVQKLIHELKAGRVSEAILLTMSNTSAKWFQEAMAVADAICFTNTNIRFIHKTKGEMGRSAIGQSFMYFGNDVENFARRFETIGYVVTPFHTHLLDARYSAITPDSPPGLDSPPPDPGAAPCGLGGHAGLSGEGSLTERRGEGRLSGMASRAGRSGGVASDGTDCLLRRINPPSVM